MSKTYSNHRERKIIFKIIPEEARDLKANVGILFVCKIRPYGETPVHTFTNFYHTNPTMDSPTEFSYNQLFINANLYEIWIFNKKSGAIYAKEIIMPLKENHHEVENSGEQSYGEQLAKKYSECMQNKRNQITDLKNQNLTIDEHMAALDKINTSNCYDEIMKSNNR